LCSFNQGQPNNGMHPTANSAALIRKTPCSLRRMLGCCELNDKGARDLCVAYGARLVSSELNINLSSCVAALRRLLEVRRRTLDDSFSGGRRRLRGFNQGQPNKSFERSGVSVAFIRET